MDRYIVMTAAAKMPSSCRGRYRRIAIVRLADGFEGTPAMISDRAHGIAEIVRTWEKLSVGKTPRGAYQQAMVEATVACAALNSAAAGV